MKEIKIAAANFTKAYKKLSEGIEMAENELNRDGVIQRFEFTFELFWKTIRLILMYEGFECRSPRSCIKEAFKHGYIIDDEIYLDMLEDRNRSSHIYDEQTSLEIFERIEKQYSKALAVADQRFKDYINNDER